ncbi:MAG TPA: zinc metallopeptidase [Anaerolineales bacterium]|nr:zinc metallopeptidase [Anaerolineales bacterium]
MYFDPIYLCIMAPAFLLMIFAQWWVSSTYKKWSRIENSTHVSGAETANRVIRFGGLYDLRVEPTGGKLTDHYDPRSKTLHLSRGVYEPASVAAMAIAAHELGHAMQDKVDYFPLKLRSALVPVVNIGSSLGWILIIIGLILQATNIAWLGVAAFGTGALFALATLPVELNASSRAKALLAESGLIQTQQDLEGVNAVLRAAAFTYVAALATALLQLLYWGMRVSGSSTRRR